MLEIACLIDAGIHAPKNDDRVAVNNHLISEGAHSETADSSCLTVVCDGVGGVAFGYRAAEIVTSYFAKISGLSLTADSIKEYIAQANAEVMATQRRDRQLSQMATTIAGLYIHENDFIAFNVGDSRVYRFRSPYIMQLSKDHSEWQFALDLGETPIERDKSILRRCLGRDYATPEILDGADRVYNGDVFILCSDGVWGSLQNEDFENILSWETTLSEKCQSLVDLALENGSSDNLSIVIIRRR